jgi:hypothetical protein
MYAPVMREPFANDTDAGQPTLFAFQMEDRFGLGATRNR